MAYEKLTVIDLFCGAGGLSKGFECAGFRIVAANDNWREALETFKENHREVNLISGDITKDEIKQKMIHIGKSKKINVVIGGPPCQDFSSAGERDGNGHRGNLTPLFAEIVAAIKPKWVVMENVNTIKSIGEQQLSRCKQILKEAGYGLTIEILNAANFGVPQERKRLFLIGRLGGRDDEMLLNLNRKKAKRITVREFMPEIAKGENATEFYYRHPRTYERRGVFSIDELSPVIRGVNRPIPKNYKFHKDDAVKDISKVRPLTTMERSQIQSFPKNYKWVGGKTSVEQQIGNAVPPVLARHIAESILAFGNDTLMSYPKK